MTNVGNDWRSSQWWELLGNNMQLTGQQKQFGAVELQVIVSSEFEVGLYLYEDGRSTNDLTVSLDCCSPQMDLRCATNCSSAKGKSTRLHACTPNQRWQIFDCQVCCILHGLKLHFRPATLEAQSRLGGNNCLSCCWMSCLVIRPFFDPAATRTRCALN
jgi:hypothetical protein